jgi:nucleoside permease NupC
VPFVKRVENCLMDNATGGTIAVLAVMAACLVATMLTAFAVLVAGVGVVLLLSSWMGTKSLALPVFVVVLMAAVAWLVRAPVRRPVERALVWMIPRGGERRLGALRGLGRWRRRR